MEIASEPQHCYDGHALQRRDGGHARYDGHMCPQELQLRNEGLVRRHHAASAEKQKAAAAAALHVLTNAVLLENITECMLGVPKFVLDFVRSMEPRYKPTYSRWFRQWRGVLPFMAIQENDMRVLKALYILQQEPLYRSNPKLQFHRVVVTAVKYGRLEVLQWLHEQTAHDKQLVWDAWLMRDAILNRHVNVMEWLRRNCGPDAMLNCGVQNIDWRERSSALGVVKWLHDHRYPFTPREMDQAAKYGHLDVVQFLHDHRREGCTANAMDGAAAHGHLGIVQFLHHNRTEGCTTCAMNDAAQSGHLDVVTFLHTHRTEGCTERAIDSAAMNNHGAVIKFLGLNRDEGCSPVMLLKVAKNGNVETVRALCEYSKRGCLVEAKRVATAWRHTAVVALLDGYISDR
uniref:Ankyrin repeat-containing domain n=1 Tax=Globisporangium ultimum (strain ATCC 200006 / CBS 805.95 / DAOM BR144) TaxID=431595 RepID=K3WIW2_GLOUD